MAGWLARNLAVRTEGPFAEFLRQVAQAPTAREGCRRACLLLAESLAAEAVVFFELTSDGKQLRSLAASGPEWESTLALTLEDLPEWQAALSSPAPSWLEPQTLPLEVPLLMGRRGLLLPLAGLGRTLGCLLAVFDVTAGVTDPEEIEVAVRVLPIVALLLDSELAREELAVLRERAEARQRFESGLLRGEMKADELDRLLVAILAERGGEAAGFYETTETGWTQVAAAGSTHLLPAQLPLGGAGLFPWECALAEARPLLFSPAEFRDVLEPWLPHWTRSSLRLGVIPLGRPEQSVGILLLCESGRSSAAELAVEPWAGFALLGAAALARRRAEGQLDLHRRRFQALFDHLEQGAFFLDPTGRLETANRALLRLTGYSPDELHERSLADLLQPADWERLCAWLQGCQPPSYAAEVEWRAKSGAWLPLDLEAHAAPELTGPHSLLLGFAHDAAGGREAGEQAQVNQARFVGLLDSVDDGVWVLDPTRLVVAANHRLAQLFGVHHQELGPGIPQSEVLERLKMNLAAAEEALARWQELEARPEEVAWDELELFRPRRRVLQRYARPLLDPEQRVMGRIEVYRDITDQRLLEDKVVQREKLATLGHLLCGIAHEINNPLTAVAGYAELLLAESLTPAVREKAARLRLEAERAGRIVKSLLLFARGVKAEKQSVHPAEILIQALSLRGYELKVENIEVVQEFSPEVPRVTADPNQLQQVFLNLLLNAEQAIRSQRRHGQILLRTRWEPGRERVLVEIFDDGPGIPPAVLPYIFDPFFTTKLNPEGTGLGLSISRALVREHGGEISVESPTSGGAIFTVELPVEPVAARPRPPAPPRRPSRVVKKEGQRILVVDDEPVVAHLIADTLRQQGHAVRVHTDSRRALAEACREPFQLIICDIRMPELDGPGFHRLLSERLPDLARRLLFTTGDTLARETLHFLEEAKLPYLPKPFHVEELRAVVSNLLHELDRSASGDGRLRPH